MSRKPSQRQLDAALAQNLDARAAESVRDVQIRPVQPPVERNRLQLDLSPSVALLLDRASAITGVPKAQIVVQCLLAGLPAVVDLAESLKQRAG